MSKERENQTPETAEDVKTQYCNGDHCQYDCPTGKVNVCNAIISGLN